MSSNVSVSWNGAFSAEEQTAVRQQLARVFLGPEVSACSCGRLTVSVFGDWLHHTFDGFLYCRCGQLLYTRLHGQLPKPAFPLIET